MELPKGLLGIGARPQFFAGAGEPAPGGPALGLPGPGPLVGPQTGGLRIPGPHGETLVIERNPAGPGFLVVPQAGAPTTPVPAFRPQFGGQPLEVIPSQQGGGQPLEVIPSQHGGGQPLEVIPSQHGGGQPLEVIPNQGGNMPTEIPIITSQQPVGGAQPGPQPGGSCEACLQNFAVQVCPQCGGEMPQHAPQPAPAPAPQACVRLCGPVELINQIAGQAQAAGAEVTGG
jgi:hypothetical protein